MDTLLLIVHTIAGTIALISGLIATLSKMQDIDHKWHVRSGRAFYYAMIVITITAFGLIVTRQNAPMFFVTVFSFFFAYVGWRFAKNRSGQATTADRYTTLAMIGFCLIMAAYGIYGLTTGEPFGIILIVFGVIGTLNGRTAAAAFQNGTAKGKERIVQHLNFMLGGFIATLTAFSAINAPRFVGYDNSAALIIAWLFPTIIFVPIMVIWERRIKQGVARKGM